MTDTVSMSVQDALWLTMDRPNNLMVVDGAIVLEGQPDFDDVRAVYARLIEKYPVFRRRAVRAGGGWAWQDDPLFDLDRHLSVVEVGGTGDMRALQDFLAGERTAPLTKDRPLWVAYLIPDMELPDGTRGAAVINRFHHAIADGVRLTQVMLGMCDVPDDAAPIVVVRQSADEGGGPLGAVAGAATGAVTATGTVVGHALSDAAAAVGRAIGHPLSSLTHLPGQVAHAPGRVLHGVEDGVSLLRHPDHLLDALEVLGVPHGRGAHDMSSMAKIAFSGNESTIWTGKPGTTKAVAWSEPIPLDRVKAIGAGAGATVNDVLLAAVAGGLRNYLHGRDALIDEVQWMVPVNLKPFADNLPEDLGNYFALVFLPMALAATAEERLSIAHERMDRIKHSDEAVLTFGLQRIVSLSPGQVAYFLTNFFANKSVGVLTNVPGPRASMTFGGVRVRQVVGFAPCSGDQPMTVTIFSYDGGVTVGFATVAGLVPDPAHLVEKVVAELDVLEEVAARA